LIQNGIPFYIIIMCSNISYIYEIAASICGGRTRPAISANAQ
jgi:hypothetical protein